MVIEPSNMVIWWDLNLQSSPSEWPCSSAEMFSAEIQPDLHWYGDIIYIYTHMYHIYIHIIHVYRYCTCIYVYTYYVWRTIYVTIHARRWKSPTPTARSPPLENLVGLRDGHSLGFHGRHIENMGKPWENHQHKWKSPENIWKKIIEKYGKWWETHRKHMWKSRKIT